MPIHKPWKHITPRSHLADLPHRWGVFEVADLDQRTGIVGIGKLDTTLAAVARAHPWLRGYRAIQLSKDKARQRFHDLIDETLDAWDGEPVVNAIRVGAVPEPWHPDGHRGQLTAPKDLAVRWHGALIPVELVDGDARSMRFQGQKPGGDLIRISLDRTSEREAA